MKQIFLAGCLCFFVIGCAHYPINPPLTSTASAATLPAGYPKTGDNSNSLFVVLAFSGGGTRAAALSYGVLKALARQEIYWEGKRRRLLGEVDVITAVSGGSVTAAYYGLFRNRIFNDFEQRFLHVNMQDVLGRELVNPAVWLRLASNRYDRVDLTADYLDKHLFERRTFAEMQRNGRPLILINATDMTSGSEFEFDEPQFNLICSDLARFSVGRAVAASSAFPIILTPVRLRNYAGSCDYQLPNWVAIALRHPDITSRRYHDALAVRSFLDARRRPYIHLMDGGIADNLGLRGLISDISGRRGSDNVLYRMGFGHAKRVVFIVVNAEAGADPRWDLTESAPTLRQMFRAVSTAQVSRNNLETIELLRQSLFKWASRVRTTRIGKKGGAGYYVVEVGFDALADEKERAFFKNLPTRFHLSGQAVKKVEAAGQRLLAESPEYRVLLRDLAAPPNHRLKID